jgi:hypothetical protein
MTSEGFNNQIFLFRKGDKLKKKLDSVGAFLVTANFDEMFPD